MYFKCGGVIWLLLGVVLFGVLNGWFYGVGYSWYISGCVLSWVGVSSALYVGYRDCSLYVFVRVDFFFFRKVVRS